MHPDEKHRNKDGSIYLCAPVNALVEGIYQENITMKEVKEHGDFGIGTFDDLDGEMVMLDSVVYQIKSDGKVTVVGDDAMTPFACVTFYEPLTYDEIDGELDYGAFQDLLNRLLPSPNIFYAMRIDGRFAHVRTRCVPRQENYRPLVEAAKEQPTFDYYDVEGTLAGFYTPTFMASLNVPGFHLHFMASDFRIGGHLLECRTVQARLGVQFINRLELSLPKTIDYWTMDFTRNVAGDLDKAEK
jgi:acetolactate decarboxylase